MLPCQPILGLKMGEISRLTFISRLGIPTRSGISQCRFQRFIRDDLATLCKNLVNVSPVTTQLKSGKYVHKCVNQQFGYVRLGRHF